ncbi:MAG: SDR family NAD(P)-dependent oxidoreductase [Tissierellia bacterium]|nr:SDR family NAD(P)-dependent oxidoreductase [Tissierellia bacterium]
MDEIEFLKNEFEKLGRKISFIQLDITESGEVIETFNNIKKEQGKIDILINVAGINKRVPTIDYEEEDWGKIVDINLKGTFLCFREAAKIMKNQKQGKIINFGSVSSVLGHPNHSAYAASKGGVLLLTKVMAMELALDNINVNTIGPKYIETDLTREYLS